MRKRSTLLDEPTPEEPSLTAGNDLDRGSHELDRAEIIISPPTPSSSVFLHSAPRPSKVRLGDVSMPSKPAARFVKSHSKRHSLSAACPRESPLDGHPIAARGNADERGRQANGGQANGRQTHPLPNLHHLQQRPWSSRSGTLPPVHRSGKSEIRYELAHLAGPLHLRCLSRVGMMRVVQYFTRSLSASLGLRYPSYHLPPLVRVQSGHARTKRLTSSLPRAAPKQSVMRRRFVRNEDQCSFTPTRCL